MSVYEGEDFDVLAADVYAAQEGDRKALERVVGGVQVPVQRMALRFFGNPVDAEDAAQEALIQVVTKLDRFNGRSAFSTWVYRVATNKFLSIARHRRDAVLDVEAFKRLLERPPDGAAQLPADVDEALIAEELKIGCTLAMLLCLEPGHRMAYILGEVMGLDHATGASVLDISAAAFRKRLQRARGQITDIMRGRCGFIDPLNPCRCMARLSIWVADGSVDPHELIYASSSEQTRRFPMVLEEIRRLEEAERAGALYRSHTHKIPKADLMGFLDRLFDGKGA
jgi:RNA polymerase sigma factor (sigma-70 family)